MMHAHFSVHFDHRHDGLLNRVARELGAAYAWLSGPGMSEHDRLRRDIAEADHRSHLTSAL